MDQMSRFMQRINDAIVEHSKKEPNTPVDAAAFALHSMASMLAGIGPMSPELTAAIHLRTVAETPHLALAAIGKAFNDPKVDAAIDAATMVLTK